MCVVYSNYGIIFFENLKFSKDASLIFQTLLVFCGKNRTEKNGTFSVRKKCHTIFCVRRSKQTQYIDKNTISCIMRPARNDRHRICKKEETYENYQEKRR